MRLSHLEVPVVGISVWIPFKPLAVSEVVLPVTLVLSAVLVPHHSFAEALAIYKLTHEECIRVFPLYVAGQLPQNLHVKLV